MMVIEIKSSSIVSPVLQPRRARMILVPKAVALSRQVPSSFPAPQPDLLFSSEKQWSKPEETGEPGYRSHSQA